MRNIADDMPGTVRVSPDGDIAIRTTDEDEAPWFHVTGDGKRYWATHDDVQNWRVRAASYDSKVELKWVRLPASRIAELQAAPAGDGGARG